MTGSDALYALPSKNARLKMALNLMEQHNASNRIF
jgi:hypothetical protein